MFKQTYKEINDSIPVNEELLKSLLNEAEKPIKVVKFKNVYKYGMAVAAALILAVSFIALPTLKVSNTPQEAKTQSLAQSDVKKNEVINQKKAPEAKTNGENEKLEAKENKTNSATISKQTQNGLAFDKSSASDSALAMTEDNGVALARMTGTPDGFEEVLIDEYLSEFEFDLSGIVLPEGVKRLDDTLLSERDENGNLVFSEHVIAYMNEDGKYLNLTITPNKEFVEEMISLYNGETVFGNDGYIGAYVLKDNGGYIVDCYNFSVNEVEALTSSLK